MTAALTLADLNRGSRQAFVAALGTVIEESPWVAERAWEARPFASLDALHAAMVDALSAADEAAQLAVLRAHPDLGTRARISPDSAGEQAEAGLDRLTPEEFDELQALNCSYREKFGFPFLLAVKGATRHDIMTAIARRLSASRDTEFSEALRQVARIARFRLESLIA
jgi:2-oxo-4-hydroxy-4-carboxy-5-ureidoimidazoline decarboxylase